MKLGCALLPGMLLVVLAAGAWNTGRTETLERRVAIRIWSKSWGSSGAFECEPRDFGWDSLTFLAAAGETLRTGVRWYDTTSSRVIIRVESLHGDSAVVRFPKHLLLPAGTSPSPEPVWDGRVVISTTPFALVTNSVDGGEYFRIGVVRPWPEPRRSPADTTTLQGIVLEDSTLAPVPWARAFVHGTRLSGDTDRNGRFRIPGVKRGVVALVVCGPAWVASEVTALTDRRPVEIRLRRRPGVRFERR